MAGGRFCLACGAPRDLAPGSPWSLGSGYGPSAPLTGGAGAHSGRTVLIVVIAVVAAVILIPMALAGLLYVGISGLTTNPSPAPIGTVFVIGNTASGTCSSAMMAMEACAGPGDFLYQLSVEYAAISLGDVNFLVRTAVGTVFVNTGLAEFALVNGSSGVAAFAVFPHGAGLA